MLKSILKGAVIGIANILPGVSGGTMAVAMGIYDKLIHCITHIHKEFKESVKYLLPIGIGAVIGLIGLARIIEIMFEKIPLETNFMFIGLIVGGLPAVWKKVKGQKIKWGHMVSCLIFFGIVVAMAAFGNVEGTQADLTFSAINCVKLFFVGVIAAATMVIPGVSGSMILLLIGYYNPILTEINGFLDALAAFDVPELVRGCGIFIPFGIGIVVGIVVIAKLIEMVFSKAPLYAYWAIIGLIASSPIGILLMAELGTFSVVHVLLGAVLFVAGYFTALKLGE